MPWDTGQTPPEVVALVESGRLQPGWALDLGCGPGVSSRYLALHGFRVIGLDLSLFALRRACRAAAASELPCGFVRGSVADISFLRMKASFALDVGCFHSLEPAARLSYIDSLADHLIPGGYYLLYTFVRSPVAGVESSGPSVSLADIAAFAPRFVLRSASHGDDRGRSSSWFLMQRS